MMKFYTVCLLISLFCITTKGNINKKVNLKDSSEIVSQEFLNKIDSLTLNWYKKHPYQEKLDIARKKGDTNNIDYPDSIYISRISDIPSVIPLSYNKIVKNFIRVYTVDKRKQVEVMLGLTDYYFPVFEKILEDHNLPNELKYLPIIESALNPNAVSRVGATGLWQFMFSTARMYKLQINSLIDERRDPIKSSYAAAKYLKDLYRIYNDWILVIAAYNCGPGNVNKAIRRSGNKRNYWEIYYYLPRETRGYVPAYIAASYVFNNYQFHNLVPREIDYTVPTDTLIIRKELHLKQVSEVLQIPHKDLKVMNPQYRYDIIPKNQKGYVLKLPLEHVNHFIELEDSIYNYKDSIYFNASSKTLKPTYYSRYSPVTPMGKAKLYYTIKPGDNLGYIAEWYNVRASDLRYWNNIRGNLIKAGKKLIVFVPKSSVSKYKSINSMSFEQKEKMAGRNPKAQETESTVYSGNFELVYHKVKPNETLWEIAQHYPGVTYNDIMKLNNIKNASKVKVGQTLKIKKPVK